MLTVEQARLCVTGFDHNRPANFPGLGDFIGWREELNVPPTEICFWFTLLATGTSPLPHPEYFIRKQEKNGTKKVGRLIIMLPPGADR